MAGMQFQGKKILVTGGTRGIGKAVARGFASEGGQLALVYRSKQIAAEETLAELDGEGHAILQADISDAGAVAQLVKDAIGLLGGLDILVNNAGIGALHRFDETDYEQWQVAWQDTLATNLLAPANLCYCAAQYMQAHGGGRIINISSRGAFRGEPDKPAYGASKAGLNALTQSLAVALGPHNIGVAAVAPGFVETDLAAERLLGPEGDGIRAQSPYNRVAKPEEVAHAVLFLASEAAGFSTGTIIDVNGASYLRS